MHGLPSHDHGRKIDWGKTSHDYGKFRPGPPASFFEKLSALGVGLPGQRLLDLGTGTGALALQFARQGCRVKGLVISEGQIATARQLADAEELDAEFAVAPAEELNPDDGPFDIATAGQCWLYFDAPKVIARLRDALTPEGLLVTSHLSWLAREDPIARASEALVLEHNPDWTAADWAGVIPPLPRWAGEDFDLRAMFYYDEAIPFTRETWRGRFRACRGVGAALSPEEVDAFDRAHDQLLREIAPEEFTVLHRVDAHMRQFKNP